MKKKTLLYILTAVLCVCACTGNAGTGGVTAISAEVVSVGLTSITVKVEADDVETYFIKEYKAANFSGITPDVVRNSLSKRVDAGESWPSLLNFGSGTYTFGDLAFGTEYKILVFGLRGDGSITEDVIVLDATTQSFSAEIAVSDVSYFGFTAKVTPNIDTCRWFPVVVENNALVSYGASLRSYIIAMLESSDVDSDTFLGPDTIFSVCNPGDEALFALVGVDDNGKIVSDIFSKSVSIPYDGFPVLAESDSENIHLALYNSDIIGIGSMIEVTKSVDDSFVFSMIDVNNVNGSAAGINFSTASEEQVASFLVQYAQENYNYMIAQNPTYFEYLEPYHRMCLMPIFPTTPSFERTWDPVTRDQLAEYLGGNTLRTVAFAACLLTIDDNEVISAVPDSFTIVKYSF